MVRRWPTPVLFSALMLAAVSTVFQPGASAQAPRAVEESFFIEKVYPTLHAVQCERCHSDNGVASCLDAKSGTPLWQHRFGGDFSASPVSAEGRIYFFDEGGAVQVIEARRAFAQLATSRLDAGCMASPAIVGRSLIVRTKTDLYRFELP